MKIGLCYNWKNTEAIRIAARVGVEYIEAGFSSFRDCTDEEFDIFNNVLSELKLPCLGYNCMLPGSELRVVGKDKNFEAIVQMFDNLIKKLDGFDGRTVTFGSGGARAPKEQNKEEAWFDVRAYLKECVAPTFSKSGWQCAIEPLCECELIKTLKEGDTLAKEVDESSVGLLIDFYHAMANGECINDLSPYKDKLMHTHIAALNGRYYPKFNDGTDYVAIFRALRDIGYEGNISIEGRLMDGESFENAITEAVAVLKQARKEIYGK